MNCTTNTNKAQTRQLFTIHSRTLGGKPTECVNARDLYAFLEVGRDFSTWMKDRIKQYGFEKSLDFVTVESFAPQNGGAKKGRGGHNAVDYFISLDMAKELSMVERNDKGRQARRYFIDCEKLLREKLKQESKQSALPLQPQLEFADRYMVEVKEGRLGALMPVPEGWFLTNIESIPKLLTEQMFLEDRDLVAIGTACWNRLSKKALSRTS